jgi:hypothetical protein
MNSRTHLNHHPPTHAPSGFAVLPFYSQGGGDRYRERYREKETIDSLRRALSSRRRFCLMSSLASHCNLTTIAYLLDVFVLLIPLILGQIPRQVDGSRGQHELSTLRHYIHRQGRESFSRKSCSNLPLDLPLLQYLQHRCAPSVALFVFSPLKPVRTTHDRRATIPSCPRRGCSWTRSTFVGAKCGSCNSLRC